MTETTTRIPTEPDEQTLVEMARRAYPGFNSVDDPSMIGTSEVDRQRIIGLMRDVYAVVSGHQVTNILPPKPEKPQIQEAWNRASWLHGLSSKCIDVFMRRFAGINPIHWHNAAETPVGEGFPVALRNEAIGPLLAERIENDEQMGFFPYVAGLESDGFRWYVQDSGLERWEIARIPGSARGWAELFHPNRAITKEVGERAAPFLLAMRTAAADQKSDEEIIQSMETFFDVLELKI